MLNFLEPLLERKKSNTQLACLKDYSLEPLVTVLD